MSPAERYRAAGVDLDGLERAKARMAQAVAGTRTALARGLPGAFGGMVRLPADVPDPTLVMSTDGVGTKVLVALAAGRHDTVGEDLVNHCVNDILVHGARPLAFLDYIGGVDVPADTLVALVEGVARGCRRHAMTLVGGETAQLPGLYESGHYDLAGTIVGVVAEGAALHGDRVAEGDALVGYASSGLHTNGYSLARRILFTDQGLGLDDTVPELGGPVGEVLLAVHRSYWPAVGPMLDRVHALAHVTGGGIPGNLARVLPRNRRARIQTASWPRPALFAYLQRAGGVSDAEMFRVFNMGVGMVAAAAPGDANAVREAARQAGVETWVIGEIDRGEGVELV
jgi:phosphoribosylformylglycinamidine cyclo-ligase